VISITKLASGSQNCENIFILSALESPAGHEEPAIASPGDRSSPVRMGRGKAK